ncbi:MAG: TnpV protein [Oscillospiraceae bacterium]|nr:TnpV protein [Oscillospiraceae bacterium]MBQ6699631.1 TnpV protein [Oscillospiraceae bacterium]
MDYTLCGDYRLPNLLPTQEEEYDIGIYGQKYFRYIKEHDRILFINLLTTGKLNSYLAEIDERAQEMKATLVKQIAEQEGINEALKEQNQMEWVKRMNSIRSRIKEIIWNEIV